MLQHRVKRSNPAENTPERYDTFEVPIEAGWNLITVLKYINEHFDGGLAHYISCRIGVCKECLVKINGRARLACMEMVTGDMTVDPISEERVIKDLVCYHKKIDD